MEILLTLVHLGAAAIVWWQPLPVWLAFALTALLLVNLFHRILAGRRRFVLACDRYGRWSILIGAGDSVPIKIRGATLASRIGLFLVYRRDGRRLDESCFIPVFAMRAGDYRHVRQRLTVTVGRAAMDPSEV